MGSVVSFVRSAVAAQDGWSQQELAEFYRVEAALLRAGLQVCTEQGLTDLAEPWFVFCHPSGDVIIHFARIDGLYLIDSEVFDGPIRGPDFRALVNQIADRYPNLLPIARTGAGTRLAVHPAALLAAIVVTVAFTLSSEDAYASESVDIGSTQASAEDTPGSQASRTAGTCGLSEQRGSIESDKQDDHHRQIKSLVLVTMLFAAEALATDEFHLGADLKHVLTGQALQASPGVTTDDRSLHTTTASIDGQAQRQSALFTSSLDSVVGANAYEKALAPVQVSTVTFERNGVEAALNESDFKFLLDGHWPGPLSSRDMEPSGDPGAWLIALLGTSSVDPMHDEALSTAVSASSKIEAEIFNTLNEIIEGRGQQFKYDSDPQLPVSALSYLSTTSSLKWDRIEEKTTRFEGRQELVKDQDSINRNSEVLSPRSKNADWPDHSDSIDEQVQRHEDSKSETNLSPASSKSLSKDLRHADSHAGAEKTESSGSRDVEYEVTRAAVPRSASSEETSIPSESSKSRDKNEADIGSYPNQSHLKSDAEKSADRTGGSSNSEDTSPASSTTSNTSDSVVRSNDSRDSDQRSLNRRSADEAVSPLSSAAEASIRTQAFDTPGDKNAGSKPSVHQSRTNDDSMNLSDQSRGVDTSDGPAPWADASDHKTKNAGDQPSSRDNRGAEGFSTNAKHSQATAEHESGKKGHGAASIVTPHDTQPEQFPNGAGSVSEPFATYTNFPIQTASPPRVESGRPSLKSSLESHPNSTALRGDKTGNLDLREISPFHENSSIKHVQPDIEANSDVGLLGLAGHKKQAHIPDFYT